MRRESQKKVYSAFGCRTCRTRKIKCDEQHPICRRCRAVGRDCYYDTQEVFIRDNVQPDDIVLPIRHRQSIEPSPNEKLSPPELLRIKCHGISRISHWPASHERAVSPVWSIDNWRHMQLQLRDIFLEECRPNYDRMEGCFTSVLTKADLSPEPLSFSATALAVVHAASKPRIVNEGLVYEAGKIFGGALTHLRRFLTLASRQQDTRSYSAYTILLSIVLIGLYGEPAESSQHPCSAQRSWEQHLHAAAQFMKKVGPNAFDRSNASEATVIQSAMLLSFKTCFSFRQRMVLEHDAPRFLCATVADTIHVPVELFQWHRIVFRLPGLLERTDILANAPHEHSDSEYSSLIQTLAQLREELLLYIHTLLGPLGTLTVPCNLDARIEEHVFISNNPLFRLQYRFSTLLGGVACILTWISCLIADCAALRLIYRRPKTRDAFMHGASEMECAAYDSATNLCRSVHFLSKRDNLTYAQTISAVLDVAGMFFAEYGAVEESAWCQACRNASRHRLDRLSLSRPRSLCRVSNVAPALVAAAQYRSQQISCPGDMIT